jgi:hypothetical protein
VPLSNFVPRGFGFVLHKTLSITRFATVSSQ